MLSPETFKETCLYLKVSQTVVNEYLHFVFVFFNITCVKLHRKVTFVTISAELLEKAAEWRKIVGKPSKPSVPICWWGG